eukprot:TRINITY_DN42795_c0_g1_i1.p1 TRINITY_DN42795_c0_g1~~TRINITY_DN42795_c0_g1_i1.p1  ORF type:complete len:367 (-),score=43.52 TRINITY_DN42795_c0_g1_i1:43-1143(-)
MQQLDELTTAARSYAIRAPATQHEESVASPCDDRIESAHMPSTLGDCSPSRPHVQELQAELCVPCAAKLGECPVWDDSRQLLCWIDIQGKRFFRHDPLGHAGNFQEFELPARPGSFCVAADGNYVFAFEDGFSFFDVETGARTKITKEFEPDLPASRLNDGRVDCQGRFVSAGTVEKGDQAASAVYRLNSDFTVEVLKKSVRCGNSICFSPELGMFFSDPAFTHNDVGSSHSIWRYPKYDKSGMTEPQHFVECQGRPDGSVLDADGCLWNAEFGGGRIVRYTPDGVEDLIVRAPVRYTTCLAFGGSDLQTLYITDASIFANQKLSKKRREELPEGYAGGLFSVRVPAKGLIQKRFAATLADFERLG